MEIPVIPRIRGRVGQVNEPEEMKGKWVFELELTTLGGGDANVLPLGIFGPYQTEAEAHKKLQEASRTVCEEIERKMMGKSSGKYIDMKTNEVRSWDLH
jgi:hypothetical protein